MSIRVNLILTDSYPTEYTNLMKDFTLIRVIGRISIRERNKWSHPHLAIIDTGAHTTVIPRFGWKDIEYETHGTSYLQGLVVRPECRVPAILATIQLFLFDNNGNYSPPLRLPAFLAESDEVPFLLGFQELFSKYALHTDYRKNEAYIEFD